MQIKLNRFVLLLVIMAVAMTSAVRVTTVYADDGTEPVTEESAAPSGEEETSTGEEQAPQESAPASEETEPAEVIEPAATEEPAAVAEIIEQLPEDSALVVVNEGGDVEPLATAELRRS